MADYVNPLNCISAKLFSNPGQVITSRSAANPKSVGDLNKLAKGYICPISRQITIIFLINLLKLLSF
jgi:hypothetical protein